MADSLETRIQIAVDAASAAQSVGELKSAIKELEGIAIVAGDSNKAAFLKASQEAGKFKDQIEDTRDAISTFKGDPLEGLSRGFGSLKGKLLDLDFQGFNEEVGRLGVLTKQVKFGDVAKSVGDTASSFGNLGKILLANPIFLLVTAVTAIIANFDKLQESGGAVGAIFSAIGDTINFVIDKLKMISDWLGLTDFKGQEKAENTLKNAEKEQSAIEDRYNAEISIAEAAGEDTKEIELKKQQAIRQSIQVQIEQLNYLAKSQGKLSDDQKKQLDDLNAAFQQSLTDTAVINAKAQKEQDDAQAAAEEKRREKAKERADKIKGEQKQVNDFLKSEEEKRLQDTLNAEDKELRQAQIKYDELVKLANGNTEILSKVEEDYRLKKEEITKKFDDQDKEKLRLQELEKNQIRLQAQEEEFNARLQAFGTQEDIEINAINQKYDKLFETLNLNAEEEKALLEKQQSEVSAVTQKFRDQELDKEKELNDEKAALKIKDFEDSQAVEQAKYDLAFSISDSIGSLVTTFAGKNEKAAKRAFQINKGIQIGQAIASTYQGANAIFASAAANPKTVLFPAQPFIAAGAAILAGLANVAKISATKFEGGSTNPGPAPTTPDLTGGGAPAPTFTPPQFFGLGQGQLQSGQPGGQQQVVVLENDITRTQNRVRVIENRATIG